MEQFSDLSELLWQDKEAECENRKIRSENTMKVVVCIKQVPDTKGGVKFNPDGTLDRAAMMTLVWKRHFG